jgi:hypothetical protein
MTAPEEAKRYGFSSLKPVIERSKEARQTLNDWNIKRPRRLQLILLGLMMERLIGDLPKLSYEARRAIETYTEVSGYD